MEKKDKHTPGDKRSVIGEFNIYDVKSTICKDFKEAREFFLDEERIRNLDRMGGVKRFFFTSFWLFKELFFKLTHVRRLLLIFALVFLFVSISGTIGEADIRIDSNVKVLGGLVLLFILMLELKDKLLAKDELAAGRTVQLALMPEAGPDIPGWEVWMYSRPANDVGGDLLDYIKLAEDRYGLALGDVAGKGLPAALFMAKLQATLRALVTEFDSLALLGGKINEIFHRDGIPRNFASLVYLEVTPGSGEVKILNAGHLPPLVLSGEKIRTSDKGNLALGILASTSYEERKMVLEPGETLIIYSDGVTEAQNEADEFYGNERFMELLAGLYGKSPGEVGKTILEAVDRFAGEAPRHDDLSLLILKKN